MKRASLLILLGVLSSWLYATNLPSQFDLRNVNGQDYVTPVKSQQGGTCWTHGTMASIEGNLDRTGAWTAAGEQGVPRLAEYHLDWWNGFNEHWNADTNSDGSGLQVHEGGDYRVATAYLARGTGAVRTIDGQSYNRPPKLTDSGYHFYYVRDVDWLSGDDSHRDNIKKAIMENGVIGTAICWSDNYYDSDNNSFYQPSSSSNSPNHSVAIVGWDDNKETDAPQKGAWLAKNSWGTDWGDNGFFWISYFDKTAGHHPQMGAVSFNHVERMQYNNVYYYDYHGWRDTRADVSEAFNAFSAKGNETLKSVSFYTAADGVPYTVRIYREFTNGTLQNSVSEKSGTIAYTGFHTIDLDTRVALKAGDKFYVYVDLSAGGQAYDRTSDVPVLLGAKYHTMVESKANPGESYYRSAKGTWVDLTQDNASANFCMKALTVNN